MSCDKGDNCDGFVLLSVGDMLGAGDRRPGGNCRKVIAEVKLTFRKWLEDDEIERCGSELDQTPHWGNKRWNDNELEVKMQTCAPQRLKSRRRRTPTA